MPTLAYRERFVANVNTAAAAVADITLMQVVGTSLPASCDPLGAADQIVILGMELNQANTTCLLAIYNSANAAPPTGDPLSMIGLLRGTAAVYLRWKKGYFCRPGIGLKSRNVTTQQADAAIFGYINRYR